MKNEKERLKEIDEFFSILEKNTAKYRKYFDALATLPSKHTVNPTPIECGNSSVSHGEIINARLESNLRRNTAK